MSTSLLNSSQRLPSNIYRQSQDSSMISLYVNQKINPKLKLMTKGIKNNFGIITCIGSQSFYVFTRQMLLHLDFQKSLNLNQQTIDDLQGYHSEQFDIQNLDIQIQGSKKLRKESLDDELDTSFARANSEQIKNLLQAQVYEIQSQYEFSHNQLTEKQLQLHHFKKSNSSFVAETPISHKQQKIQIKNYIQKNDQTLSQTGKNYSSHQPSKYQKLGPTQKDKLPNLNEESFLKDLKNFKQSIQKKKIHDSMVQKGLRKIVVNGQEKFVQRNDFLRFYSDKQIGTDKDKKPIQWLYCELKDTNPESILTAYLLSSTIVYDLPFEKQPTKEKFQKEIRDYFQFYKRLENEMNQYDDSNSDMPQVVIICPIEDSQKMENDKAVYKSLFAQIESYYFSESKKNGNIFQSPFNQFQKNQSPSMSKLPPTPKRIPMSHKTIQNQHKKKVRLQFRIISEQLQKSGVLREDYSRMREITSQGRLIFNEQPIKMIGGNWITSQCFINLLERLRKRIPLIDVQRFYEEWQSVFEDFIKMTMEQAAGKYEEKVNELIVGKTMVSQAKLMEVHQVAKKETLRQLGQKKIGTSRVVIESGNLTKSGVRLPSVSNLSLSRKMSVSRKLVQSRKDLNELDQSQEQGQVQEQELMSLIQSRIEQQRQELLRRTKQESVKWCRKFLTSQYEQINKKLISNQIKSIPNYKQELQFLKDTYKKKLQNYSALQFQMMELFNEFLLQNIFTGLDLFLSKERQQTKDKLNKQTKKTQQSQTQFKQLKKTLFLKQRTFSQQKVQLENKLYELHSSINNFTHQIELKQNQISTLKNQYEEKLHQQQNIFNQTINGLKNTIEDIKKQVSLKNNDLVYLQSQLQKQQLLHQQTHTNYEQILSTYKSNSNQLEKKIKQLKEVILLNQEKLKNSISKQKMQQEIKKVSDKENKRIQQLQNMHQEKSKEMMQEKVKLNEKIQQNQDKIRSLQRQKSQLSLQHKILQQKLLQIQSRLPRYKSIETQLEKSSKDKQQLHSIIQSLSSQKLLLEQKITLNNQQFQKIKKKLTETFKKQAQTLHDQIQQLKIQNNTYHKKIYDNKKQAEVQTSFTLNEREQITIKSKCKNCQQNKYRLSQALRIVDALNQSYQKMKFTYLNNQCVHCIQGKRQK